MKISRSQSSTKVGTLHSYIKKVTRKDGTIAEYPIVSGERDPNNPDHWQWQITWKEKDKADGAWKPRSRSVRPHLVEQVKTAIAASTPIEEILQLLPPPKQTKTKSGEC